LNVGLTTLPQKKTIIKKLLTKNLRTPTDNSGNRQGNRSSKSEFLRLRTWNIRTLYKPGALQNIIQAIKNYRPEIVVLQEMRWPENGNLKSGEVTLFYSGSVFDIVLINCYAPTETADTDLKDAFYETLEKTFNSIPSHSIKIVLGDMNTQVGRERAFEKRRVKKVSDSKIKIS